MGPCPQQVSPPIMAYKAPCLSLGGNAWFTPSAAGAYVAARSKHPTGVVVAMTDGSLKFVANNVSLTVWRSAGTRQGGETTTSLD